MTCYEDGRVIGVQSQLRTAGARERDRQLVVSCPTVAALAFTKISETRRVAVVAILAFRAISVRLVATVLLLCQLHWNVKYAPSMVGVGIPGLSTLLTL